MPIIQLAIPAKKSRNVPAFVHKGGISRHIAMKTIKAFLDRYEEDKAVLIAEEQTIIIPQSMLPEDAVAGSYLAITIACDQDESAQAKDNVKKLIDRLGDD